MGTAQKQGPSKARSCLLNWIGDAFPSFTFSNT